MHKTHKSSQPTKTELGQISSYDLYYNPERLFAIARCEKRQEIGVDPVHLFRLKEGILGTVYLI